MKQIATFGLIAALSVAAPAVQAQDASPTDEGFSLMEEGAKLLLRGLLEEMEPALEDLEGLALEMGPAMEELRGMIGDFSAYELPEVLPNGDIIIRRKTPLEDSDDPSETEI
ncbi:hypothetical protein [Halocynthiibacter sp.]|uniref:hypothetical protein n=1 Tax=Halocynthiibacter sp. TaxID=1979210 RepID=UPI003C4E8494